jgi:hypothetical protein
MSKRVLVVEDEEDNRRIMRDLLTSVGYEIISKRSATPSKSDHRRLVHFLTRSGIFPARPEPFDRLRTGYAERSRRASHQVLRMLRLRPAGYAQHERI